MSTVTGLGTKRRRRRSSIILPMLSLLMLLTGIGVFVFELIAFSQQQTRLPAETTVAGVDVGGLLPTEARARWESAYTQDIVMYYDESPILLDPTAINFRTQSELMLAAARSAIETETDFWTRFLSHLTGRQAEQIINIPLEAAYQVNQLEEILDDISARYDRTPENAAYDLETLTISAGGSGFQIDRQAALQRLDLALRDPNNRRVDLPLTTSESGPIGLQTLERMILEYLDVQGFPASGPQTVVSVYILDLQTGEEININGDVAFSAASMIKVPILIDYFHHLTFAPSPEEAWLMANSLLCSNNSSSNLIMQIIGNNDIFRGLSSVTQRLQYLGANNTFITAPFDLGIEGQVLGSIPAPPTNPNPNFNTRPDPFNQATVEDFGMLFTMIYDCANYGSGLMAAFPEGEFTRLECQQMLELMSANDLQRLLQAGLPPGTRISHKNGWIADTHGDVGIVYPPNGRNYVIGVILWQDTDFLDYNVAWPIIEDISRATWNYFYPEGALTSRRQDLPVSAQECEGNYLPPSPAETNLNDIDAWRTAPQPAADETTPAAGTAG